MYEIRKNPQVVNRASSNFKPHGICFKFTGGFLAKDWCDSYELGPLARKSFELHEQLAKEFGNTDYRKLDTLSVTVKVSIAIVLW